MNPADRLPPHSRDAEQSVIGAMLRDNDRIDDVRAILPGPVAFYFDAHQRIYAAIVAMHDKRVPVDLVTMANTLAASGQLEAAGGHSYLAELSEAAGTAANVEYYAHIVRGKSIRRTLIHAGTDLIRDAYDPPGDDDTLLAEAQTRILGIGEHATQSATVPIAAAVADALAEYDRADVRISTGFVDIDQITIGFQPRELTVIAARPSVGKTAMACALLRYVAGTLGIPALFFSLEQSQTEIGMRLVCSEAGLNSRRWQRREFDQRELGEVTDAQLSIASWPLSIADGRMTASRIAAESRRAWRRTNVGFIVVDYLQFIAPENEGQERRHQLGRQTKTLKALAKELAVPVVCLCQLKRLGDGRDEREPRLSDLSESGEIEQDADVVWLMHRPEPDRPLVSINVAKNRNGATALTTVLYRATCMRFENFSPFDGSIPPETPKPSRNGRAKSQTA